MGFYSINGFRDNLGNVLLNPEVEGKHNSIVNTKFYLRDYKTVKKYGVLEFDIPEKLIKLIEKSIEVYPRKFLIIQKDNEEQTTFNLRLDKVITQIFKTQLKRVITINDVRKAWVSEVFESSPEKQVELSKRMGHDLSTALLYYKQTSNKKVV